jgi:hypothetical protein
MHLIGKSITKISLDELSEVLGKLHHYGSTGSIFKPIEVLINTALKEYEMNPVDQDIDHIAVGCRIPKGPEIIFYGKSGPLQIKHDSRLDKLECVIYYKNIVWC